MKVTARTWKPPSGPGEAGAAGPFSDEADDDTDVTEFPEPPDIGRSPSGPDEPRGQVRRPSSSDEGGGASLAEVQASRPRPPPGGEEAIGTDVASGVITGEAAAAPTPTPFPMPPEPRVQPEPTPSSGIPLQAEAPPSPGLPLRQPTPTPAPFHPPATTPTPTPRPITPVPGASHLVAAPEPYASALPHAAPATVEPTQLVRAVPSRFWAAAVSAVIASLLGLGAGYLIWGHGSGGAAAPGGAPPPSSRPEASSAGDESAGDEEGADGAKGGEGGARAGEAAPEGAGAAKEACAVRITSYPRSARVFVGDERLGKTPYEGQAPCGEITFDLRRVRYRSVSESLHLAPGERATVRVHLERPTFRLRVLSKPKNAAVKIDGRPVGRTPLAAPVTGFERSRVTVEKPGYRPWSKRLYPKRRQTTLRAQLERR